MAGDNYHTDTTDAITDAFDSLLEQYGGDLHAEARIICKTLRKAADRSFRHQYSTAKQLLKSLE